MHTLLQNQIHQLSACKNLCETVHKLTQINISFKMLVIVKLFHAKITLISNIRGGNKQKKKLLVRIITET